VVVTELLTLEGILAQSRNDCRMQHDQSCLVKFRIVEVQQWWMRIKPYIVNSQVNRLADA
jgi:hypothetical protein